MNLYNDRLNSSFREGKVVKIISGIDNFNINKIFNIISACEISKATYIDVAANPDIISFIKSISSLPICVSSIDSNMLYNSVVAGADLVEIGNFDCFYKNGIYLSIDEIVKIVKQTKYLLSNIDICVTIPHTLTLNKQVYLAQKLEQIGVNLLQTEGIQSNCTNNDLLAHDHISYSASIASSTLSSIYLISQAVNIPVIASSGINKISASVALSYGASGVGIRSAISQINDILGMSKYINEIIFSTSQSLCQTDNNGILITQSNYSIDKLSFI